MENGGGERKGTWKIKKGVEDQEYGRMEEE